MKECSGVLPCASTAESCQQLKAGFSLRPGKSPSNEGDQVV